MDEKLVQACHSDMENRCKDVEKGNAKVRELVLLIVPLNVENKTVNMNCLVGFNFVNSKYFYIK